MPVRAPDIDARHARVRPVTGMRVGLVFGGQAADTGGGFVFQEQVFASLAAQVSSRGAACGHAFTVLAHPSLEARVRELAAGASIGFEPVQEEGLVGRLVRQAQRHASLARVRIKRPGALEQAAVRARCDYLWFLSPACELVELPYTANVWDLQHRTLPWFPELAGHGEWDERESANHWFLQRASMVVTGTEAGAAELARFYGIPDDHVRLIPHPTPADALDEAGKPLASARGRFGLEGPYLLYPAQFWPHKNHACLVEALALLAEQGHTPALVLSGSEKGNRAHIEQLARDRGVHGSLRFTGFIERATLLALYREAAAMVYPSFGGPENLPPLEAFALGCPVVAADVPGAREQLGDAALLADPRSPAAFAAAIASVLGDTAVAQGLRERGRVRALRTTGTVFAEAMLGALDGFAPIRAAWGAP